MMAVVRLAEKVTLQTISGAYDAVAGAIAKGHDLELDLGDLCEGDLALVQLILAARAEAERHHRHMRLTYPANPVLVSLLTRAGLFPQTPADVDFWFHGVVPA